MTHENPTRLRDLTPGADAVERVLGKHLRTLEPAPRLSPAARARVLRGLEFPQERRGRGVWMHRFAVAAMLLIVFAGAVGAATWTYVRYFRPAPAVAPRPPASRAVSRTVFSKPSPAPAAPASVAPTAVPHRARATRIALAETPPAPEPSPSGLAGEAQLLREALVELRQNKNPRRALERLDQYAAIFPHGVLRPEVAVTRVDALLMSGDKAAALKILDALSLEHVERARELHVLRGDLRAWAGRCSGAIEDFSTILRDGGAVAPSERGNAARALAGRAACFSRLGNEEAARIDRERHAREYPGGAR